MRSEDFAAAHGIEYPEIPTVHVETDIFSADLYELYEMPSELVLGILGAEGPAQMEIMAEAFRLAIVNPEDVKKMDILSFNELASAMFQWYKKSTIRVAPVKNLSPNGKKTRTLQEILETISVVEEMLSGEEETEKKPRFYKPLNDPGDGINPFA